MIFVVLVLNSFVRKLITTKSMGCKIKSLVTDKLLNRRGGQCLKLYRFVIFRHIEIKLGGNVCTLLLKSYVKFRDKKFSRITVKYQQPVAGGSLFNTRSVFHHARRTRSIGHEISGRTRCLGYIVYIFAE